MTTLICLLGAVDGGEALRRTLSGAGLDTRPGSADAGLLLAEQLAGAEPMDAYWWSRVSVSAATALTAVRFVPGADGGLEPSLPRALSDATRGLVLAMEATRTRDRYLVGSFLSGRTVELSRSVVGIARGPAGARLHDDEMVGQIFTAWLTATLGVAVPALPTLGVEPEGALLAPPWRRHDSDQVAPRDEAPLYRTAVRHQDGRVSVAERADPQWRRDVADLPVGATAAVVELGRPSESGAAGDTNWALIADDGTRTQGMAHNQLELGHALPSWALAAPTRCGTP